MQFFTTGRCQLCGREFRGLKASNGKRHLEMKHPVEYHRILNAKRLGRAGAAAAATTKTTTATNCDSKMSIATATDTTAAAAAASLASLADATAAINNPLLALSTTSAASAALGASSSTDEDDATDVVVDCEASDSSPRETAPNPPPPPLPLPPPPQHTPAKRRRPNGSLARNAAAPPSSLAANAAAVAVEPSPPLPTEIVEFMRTLEAAARPLRLLSLFVGSLGISSSAVENKHFRVSGAASSRRQSASSGALQAALSPLAAAARRSRASDQPRGLGRFAPSASPTQLAALRILRFCRRRRLAALARHIHERERRVYDGDRRAFLERRSWNRRLGCSRHHPAHGARDARARRPNASTRFREDGDRRRSHLSHDSRQLDRNASAILVSREAASDDERIVGLFVALLTNFRPPHFAPKLVTIRRCMSARAPPIDFASRSTTFFRPMPTRSNFDSAFCAFLSGSSPRRRRSSDGEPRRTATSCRCRRRSTGRRSAPRIVGCSPTRRSSIISASTRPAAAVAAAASLTKAAPRGWRRRSQPPTRPQCAS